MANKKETEDILVNGSIDDKESNKAAKKKEKLSKKKEKADAKKAELAKAIDEVKTQIAGETDEKNKKKLRKKRDELIKQRDGITSSKDGMSIPMAANTKRIITTVVIVVMIIALLCAYFATGACRKGLMSFFSVPQSTLTGMTLTDDEGEKHSIKVSTYNYYFAMAYNNIKTQQDQYSQYGIDLSQINLDVDLDKKLSEQTTKNEDDKTVTWAEYLEDQVIDSIKSTYTYYYEAVAANKGKEPKITEDQEKELKETLEQYEESAHNYGYTLSAYLTAAMGKGVNEKTFKREATISYIAENYQEDYKEELSNKEYKDSDYEKYRDENKDDLNTVDIRLFECDSEDDAKAFVKALKADGSNFAALASKYSSDDFDKQANKEDVQTTYKAITKPSLKGINYAIASADEDTHKDGEEHSDDEEQKYSGLDWLYSTKRKAGDIKQYSTSVVYVLKPVYLSNIKTVNVRHILISPITDENDDTAAKDATDKQWEAAKKTADKILKEFRSGKKTSAEFSKLAKENSKDGNASTGGLYENIVPNQMVPSFNEWCFDSSRKNGDTAIVKTQYGYHIMYFEKTNKLTVWQYTAQQALASKDSEKTTTKLEDSYKIKKNWFGSRYFEKDIDIDA